MSNAEQLYRVFYISKATRPMTHGELEDLLLGARKRNEKLRISGLLIYDAGNFAQVLEGPRESVQALLSKIGNDPRHEHTTVVSEWVVEHRDFDDWSMGFQNIHESKAPNLAPLREIMRTRRVKEAGVAYAFMRAFCAGL